jgi:hypothetical protein
MGEKLSTKLTNVIPLEKNWQIFEASAIATSQLLIPKSKKPLKESTKIRRRLLGKDICRKFKQLLKVHYLCKIIYRQHHERLAMLFWKERQILVFRRRKKNLGRQNHRF